MPNKTFRYAAFVLRILEKLLGSNFSVTGIEKLPKQPVMFVANHFTRAETFFVPYLIFRNTKRQVRCLADSTLFRGSIGKFLESIGAISTKDKDRDKIIIGDLMSNNYDWMIYPEGIMLKNKEVKKYKNFVNYTPSGIGSVRSGAAILALKSQLYRNNLNQAFANNDQNILAKLHQEFDIDPKHNLENISTHIVPVNITYYPLRPGENKIKKLAKTLVKDLPKRIAEELEIEGNLLLNSEININFGDPIDLKDYIKNINGLVDQLPIIKDETKNNLILKYFKNRLTNHFMAQIYGNIQVNFDHIFSSALVYVKESSIDINRLKRIIYLSGVLIAKSSRYRINSSLREEKLCKIFSDEKHQEFDSVFELAKEQGVIEQTSPQKIKIRKALLNKKYDFHQIRLENSLYVIANEFSLLDFASNIVKNNASIDDNCLKNKVFSEIYNRDLAIFDNDYEQYFDSDFSKDKSIAKPHFYDNINSDTAILLCHGYKAAPKEVEALAKFLNNCGFKVYNIRLQGHGTAPINMKDVTYENWYDSLNRAYAALYNISDKIIIIGFSTGGLLSILAAARKKLSSTKLKSIVTINAALKLQDIKAKMVPGIKIWNDLLTKLKLEKGKFEYIDDVPENPKINYSRNYLKGVVELSKLMDLCNNNLKKIKVPTLVIQANKDPVVNPISGKIIFDKINAKNKKLEEMDFSNHVIINSDGKEKVFKIIEQFLKKLDI